jgi:cytochrome P450
LAPWRQRFFRDALAYATVAKLRRGLFDAMTPAVCLGSNPRARVVASRRREGEDRGMATTGSMDSLGTLSGGMPILGHMMEVARDRQGVLDRITAEVDRISRVRGVGNLPVVCINHPETIQELLVERHREFDKASMQRFALYPMVGEGLFTARGDLWKRQRRLMAPLFHPPKIVRFADDMVACTDRAIDEWKDGDKRSLLRETTRVTMSVAGKTLFQADTFSEADEIGQSLTVALNFAADNSPSPLAVGHLLLSRALHEAARWVPSLARTAARFERPVLVPGEEGRRLRGAIAFLDATVQQMIDDRRAAPEQHNDLLSRLLEVRDEEDGGQMSDKQIRDEILTLFIAGHETTATALAWSIYELCRNPTILAAARAEADALGRAPTHADLPKLPLTLRIFKEALRLYPPVYLDSRQAEVASELGGVACPRFTVAMFSPYSLHRRADLWPDPLRFDPDRYLPEIEAKRSRFAWLPFGVGPRICIGMGFALMEGQLVLARLLQRADFELVGSEEPNFNSATLRPKYGMQVRIKIRETGNGQRATGNGQ